MIKNNMLMTGLLSCVVILLIALFYTEVALILFPSLISCILLLHVFWKTKSGMATIFHPLPLVSLIMLWAFVFAPIYSIVQDYYLARPPAVIDWMEAIRYISWVYLFCIIFFWGGVHFIKLLPPAESRRLKKNKLIFYSFIFLGISFCIQLIIYQRFGGLSGFMTSWSEDRSTLQGFGKYFMLAESFPIILFFTVILLFKDKKAFKRLVVIGGVLLIFFFIKLLFGGFRGSRSNTIWGMFWAVGIIHILVRRFSPLHFILGVVFLFSFMQVYTLYKSFGVSAFTGAYTLEDTGRFKESSHPLNSILIGDFSRAGVNAYVISRYDINDNYQLKYGQTYISSLSKLFPFIDSSKIHNKNSAGAEAFYEQTINLEKGDYFNSRIYGFQGEAFLNYGLIPSVLLFFLLGVIIASIHRYTIKLDKDDPRALLVPFYSNLSLMLVLADSDNVIFFLLKNGVIPMLFIYLVSKRFRGQEC